MICKEIASAGTSIWLDDLSRSKITGHDEHSLPSRILHADVVGVTTNPSIFNSAISKGAEYASDIQSLNGFTAEQIVQKLTTDDVRNACDLFATTARNSLDGRVSIEVDPRKAHQTQATIDEGVALWNLVDRSNAMIKVPATLEGLPAVTALISLGISVNVTLIFSVERYVQVIEAFMSGLEIRASKGEELSSVSSVASFFISRIDTAVDDKLKSHSSPQATALLGKAAIANASIAYEAFEKVLQSPRWKLLSDKGAHMQRPLWASTGVKDPGYDDTRYVIELIAPHTVNTMPQATLDALLDHGVYRGENLSSTYSQSHAIVNQLFEIGIDLDEVTTYLEHDGVKKFIASWEELLANVSQVMNP